MAYNPPFPGGPGAPPNYPPGPHGGAFPPGGPFPPGGYNPSGPTVHPPPPGGFQPGPPGGFQPGPPGGYQPGPPGGYQPGPPGGYQPGPPPPVMNPPTPSTHALPGPAQDGLMVVVQGFVPPTSKRFHINMSSGAGYDEQVPIALHLNPRFEGTNQVVRNSFLNRSWQNEERQGAFPFRPGTDFECIILFTMDSFKVAINGAHYCDFRYRTRKEDVTHIAIEGDVTIRTLRFTPPASLPPMNPPYLCPGPPLPNQPPMQHGPMPPMAPMPPVRTYSIGVPYEQRIQGGLIPGRTIHISGKPTNKDRFDINLCYHNSHKRDIAFHFNPRFNENAVVRNSMAGFTWGKEERRQPNFPFKKGEHFDIMIMVHSDKYVVLFNGHPFIEFVHRLRNLAHIQLLYIAGGVQLSEVRVQ